ncbi:hypothetical protein KEM54_004367 [Ascosphaera aggregata]|nr:hypothetical protein KEM54_004367 [Ascosphaera aggregata]
MNPVWPAVPQTPRNPRLPQLPENYQSGRIAEDIDTLNSDKTIHYRPIHRRTHNSGRSDYCSHNDLVRCQSGRPQNVPRCSSDSGLDKTIWEKAIYVPSKEKGKREQGLVYLERGMSIRWHSSEREADSSGVRQGLADATPEFEMSGRGQQRRTSMRSSSSQSDSDLGLYRKMKLLEMRDTDCDSMDSITGRPSDITWPTHLRAEIAGSLVRNRPWGLRDVVALMTQGLIAIEGT